MENENKLLDTDFNIWNGIKLAIVIVGGIYIVKYFANKK